MAQQNAGVNSTFTYSTTASVAGGSTFTWNVYNHGTTTPAAGYTVISGAGTTDYKLQWTATGDYDIVVREVSANGCSNPTSDKLQEVIIASNFINLTAYTNTPSCWSATDGSLPFTFTYVPGASDYPIVVTYTVSLNGAAATTQTYTLNSSADATTLTIPGFLNNTTTGDVTNVVTITGTTFNGSAISLGATVSASQTVYAKPATNGITIN